MTSLIRRIRRVAYWLLVVYVFLWGLTNAAIQ